MPLYLRLTVLVFSLAAMVLAVNIWRREIDDQSLGASTIMAIGVDAIAIVYLLYIMYDEYTGKPLGLRSAKAKLRLILLDLFFIIFQSANLSLSFDSLIHFFDDDYADVRGRQDYEKQRGLSAVLLIALVAWLSTFAVSIFRYGLPNSAALGPLWIAANIMGQVGGARCSMMNHPVVVLPPLRSLKTWDCRMWIRARAHGRRKSPLLWDPLIVYLRRPPEWHSRDLLQNLDCLRNSIYTLTRPDRLQGP